MFLFQSEKYQEIGPDCLDDVLTKCEEWRLYLQAPDVTAISPVEVPFGQEVEAYNRASYAPFAWTKRVTERNRRFDK